MRPRSGEASPCENLHLTAAIIADLGWGRQARPKPLRGPSLDPPKTPPLLLVSPITPCTARPSLLSAPGRRRSRIVAHALSRFRKPSARYILEHRGLARLPSRDRSSSSGGRRRTSDGGFVES